MNGSIGFEGTLVATKIPRKEAPLSWKIRNWMRPSFLYGLTGTILAHALSKTFGIPTLLGKLELVHIGGDGTKTHYGVVGRRVVTTAFAEFMVDQLQTETSQWGDFKYHDSGVGTTAENASDTDIETTDGESRATGTQTEGTSVQYVSVGTIAYTTTKAITEHGLFSQAAGTTLMDRTVFSAVNVVNGDSIQFTYTLSVTAGS